MIRKNDLQVQATIAKFGLFIQAVFRCQPGDKEFAYTIGLSERYGHELIVFGLRGDWAAMYFNMLSVEYLSKGPLPLDTPIKFDTESLPVMFKRCDPAKVSGYVQQAFNYYDREDIAFVQMVLCDKEGRFPADPAFDHAMMDPLQALLYPVTH